MQREALGREMEFVLLDPDRRALSGLGGREGLSEVEEKPLSLEEIYTALLGGHRPVVAVNGQIAQPHRAAMEKEAQP